MDHQEIADKILEVFSNDLSEPEKDLIKKTPQGLTAESPVVIGFIGPLILRSSLKKLSENIEKADKSSGKLTKAIVALTSIGMIIAGESLYLEICKQFNITTFGTALGLVTVLIGTVCLSIYLSLRSK